MPGTIKLEPIRRRNVKLVIPSAGVFALYLGGLFGVFIVTRAKSSPSWFTLMFSAGSFATLLAFAAMTAADAALGEEASHVDIIKTVVWMVGAWAAVVVERQLGDKVGWALPQFIENLLVWGCGVASIWEEEPDFPGWKPALRSVKDRLRARAGR